MKEIKNLIRMIDHYLGGLENMLPLSLGLKFLGTCSITIIYI